MVACLAALIWPGYAWVAASPLAQARPLGLPFVLLWHVGWVLATFAATALYHLTRPGQGARS